MKLPQNIKTFLTQFPLKKMKGEEVFTVIVFFLAKGKKDVEIKLQDVKKNWSKTIIRKSYNSSFSNRAQGHVNPCDKGKICLTDEGIECVDSLSQEIPTSSTKLIIFSKGSAHSFDKFLRKVFKKAKKNVDIADTYVTGNIFDNLLDEIPKVVPLRFLYGKDNGGFISKSQRFAKEYSFQSKESKQFHDRFVIVDNRGYIIGPSLKDAADKKPTTLVVLNSIDSKELSGLFFDLWVSK